MLNKHDVSVSHDMYQWRAVPTGGALDKTAVSPDRLLCFTGECESLTVTVVHNLQVTTFFYNGKSKVEGISLQKGKYLYPKRQFEAKR